MVLRQNETLNQKNMAERHLFAKRSPISNQRAADPKTQGLNHRDVST
jgi:hypothetical protein